MEAGTHLFSLFTYFYQWGPEANSKAVAVLPPVCRQRERFSLPIPFPSTNKISTEDTQLSQQCRCHQMSALFQSMNQSSVRASYPASPDKSAVTSEGTKRGEIPLSHLLQASITHWYQQCLFQCNFCCSTCRLLFFLNPTSWSQKMLWVYFLFALHVTSMSICTCIHVWIYKYQCFLEHKLFVLSPVRPVRAACAISPGAGCSLYMFFQYVLLLEKKRLISFDSPTMLLTPKPS